MALKLQRGEKRPIKIPCDLLYLIPPWIFSHPVWTPTCFQSRLLSRSVIYTNVTVSPPFTLFWGSSLAVSHVDHILFRGGKNTFILYASLRQDLQGKVPVTHFGYFCAPQVAQSTFFKINVNAGGKKKMLELRYRWVETLKMPIGAADTSALWMVRFSLLTCTKARVKIQDRFI